MAYIPNQNKSKREKGKKWGENTVTGFINLSNISAWGDTTTDKYELQKLYKVCAGQNPPKTYSYVTDPFNAPDEKHKRFPMRMRNHPVIGSNVMRLVGERRRRPFNPQVIIKNPDAVSLQQKMFKDILKTNLQQQFINFLAQQGFEVPEEEVQSIPELQEHFKRTYKDDRQRKGQLALNFIMAFNSFFNRSQKAWKDMIIAGMPVTYRGVNQKEVDYEVISPLDADFGWNPRSPFAEDADWQVVRKMMYASEVIDNFYDVLKPDQVKELERLTSSTEDHQESAGDLLERGLNASDSEEEWDSRMVEVFHVCWKSRKKIGIYKFIDEFGAEQMLEVDEDFKPREDEEVEWFWVNEAWEGYRIGKDMYVGINPLEVQRNSLDNLSTCKLPYNAVRYWDQETGHMSLVKQGLPLNELYDIFMYRMEEAFATNNGSLTIIDINQIPTNKMGMEEWLYRLKSTKIAFVDGTKDKGGNINKVLNTSQAQFVKETVEALMFIEERLDSMFGMTPQRKGQINSSAGLGTTQEAIYRGTSLTEEMFARFEELCEKDLQALLDYSKVAWIEGKKTSFILDDGSTAFFEMDGVAHMDTEYGVFVSNSTKLQERVEMAKNLLQPMAQNFKGRHNEMLMGMLDTDDMSTLKEIARKADIAAEQIAQQDQEFQQTLEQSKIEWERLKMDNENTQKQLDRESKEKIAYMNNQAKLMQDAFNLDEDDDTAQMEQIYKNNLEQQKVNLEREKMSREDSNKDRDRQLKREEMQSKEKIEKIKLKNPVPGEKIKK